MTHVPVLLNETVDTLNVRTGGVYVDGTLGRAGHSCELLARAGGVATLVGIDRDETALAESRARLASFPAAAVHLVHGRHGEMADAVARLGLTAVDGILLDLGVSSPQLDEPGRGFSFRSDGPLDMRMDRSRGTTAAELVNASDEDTLVHLFRTLGEEPNARRIAKAIVAARTAAPFTTTRQLADLVERTVGRRGAHHPATRVFQALRMAVNDELGELERALTGGLGLLAPGGRFAVITFESLSDRMVKRFFAAHAGRMVSLQAGGARWEGDEPRVRLVTRRPVVASADETERNPRARSAKLRVVERC